MIENYDGLCGIIASFASSDLQLRCQYELGHCGKCSWEKYREQFYIQSSCRQNVSAERGFVDSVIHHRK